MKATNKVTFDKITKEYYLLKWRPYQRTKLTTICILPICFCLKEWDSSIQD
jgi:hypothetical protein